MVRFTRLTILSALFIHGVLFIRGVSLTTEHRLYIRPRFITPRHLHLAAATELLQLAGGI